MSFNTSVGALFLFFNWQKKNLCPLCHSAEQGMYMKGLCVKCKIYNFLIYLSALLKTSFISATIAMNESCTCVAIKLVFLIKVALWIVMMTQSPMTRQYSDCPSNVELYNCVSYTKLLYWGLCHIVTQLVVNVMLGQQCMLGWMVLWLTREFREYRSPKKAAHCPNIAWIHDLESQYGDPDHHNM